MQSLILEEAKSFLKMNGWLTQVPDPFADALLSIGSLETTRRDEVVYNLGDSPDGLRGVISGAFALETAPNEREPNLVHLFRPGFWFGESEQYDKRPRFTTIVATRDSLCLRISQSRLEEFVSAHPEFWRWFGLLSIQHLLLALEVIDDTLQRDPGHRIEALLLRLANQRGRNVTGDPRPEIDATQSELAHLTNISRATVAAHLKLLEENGLVAREYGRLVILNPTRLRDRLRQRLDS